MVRHPHFAQPIFVRFPRPAILRGRDAPICLSDTDEVADPGALALWTDVNGTRMQNSNTADLIFGVDHIVSYLSHFMTLLPGAMIATGTPSGVGLGLKPPRFLKPGDTMRLSVEGLGEQNRRLVAYQG